MGLLFPAHNWRSRAVGDPRKFPLPTSTHDIMSRKTLFALVFLFIGSVSAVRAQHYFGRVSNVDVWFFYSDDGTRLRMNFFNSGLENGEGVIASNQTGLFTTTSGRQVTFRITHPTITGTVAGQNFSAQAESVIGPQSAVAGLYTGIFQNRLRVNTETMFGSIRLYPSGRALMVVSNTGGFVAGLGTRANGVVSITSTTGVVFRFNFAGDAVNDSFVQTIGANVVTDFYCTFVRQRNSSLINVATRGQVRSGQPMTAGFVITDSAKTVLIRAVGPTLGVFGVPGVNADPALRLFAGQTVIAQNDNWGDSADAADLPSASAQVGAFALQPGSRDAAILITLSPGAYTAEASTQGAGGDSLVEVYEVSK